jgi:succinate dehydrogenase / fumarate reductase cytochrome b subunit
LKKKTKTRRTPVVNLKYAYYPGCASKEITKEADKATRLVCTALGIELVPMPKANCCGAGLLTDYDYELSLALNARIFSEAEAMGLDMLTICSTCLMVMSSANRDMKNDGDKLNLANNALSSAGLHYSGKGKLTHLLWVLAKDYGLEKLSKKVVKPLTWLKVAPFYGCHSLRPSDALGVDDPQKPWTLDAVIKALGAKPVEYKGKTKCCGFQIDLVTEDTAVKMTGKRLIEAKTRGADCLVTPCPFCHINLDNYQGLAEKKAGQKIELPVFHLAQLVGLALGLSAEDMGLTRHLVSAEEIIR